MVESYPESGSEVTDALNVPGLTISEHGFDNIFEESDNWMSSIDTLDIEPAVNAPRPAKNLGSKTETDDRSRTENCSNCREAILPLPDGQLSTVCNLEQNRMQKPSVRLLHNVLKPPGSTHSALQQYSPLDSVISLSFSDKSNKESVSEEILDPPSRSYTPKPFRPASRHLLDPPCPSKRTLV